RREASAAEEVRADADAGTGRQQGADAGLHVRADQGADLRASAVDLGAIDEDAHGSIVVLEIAGGGERTQVHPLADRAVADEAVMPFVRVSLPHRFLDLAGDPALRADARSHHAAAEELGLGADHAGPFDMRMRR